MDKRGIVIEQLFEDFPSDVFTSGLKPKEEATTKPSKEPKEKSNKGQFAVSGSRITSSPKSLNNITAVGLAVPSSSRTASGKSAVGSPVAEGANPRKSKSQKQTSAPARASCEKGPRSPTTAILLYGDKLTKYEVSEIQNFPHIYYAGVAAKKLQVESATEAGCFDDEDNFYRVVPRDHIGYRYEVMEKPSLGKGTFGQVIKAFDHKEKKMVAIKMVRNERIYLKQSREELRILQVLRKQDTTGSYNIVQLLDFFMFRNHMCFVFELLGMNLYQVLKKNHYRGLGTAKILLIARAVLKCLELLFKNRIIHCDIKPENIMLRRNGDFTSVKVGDFGSSCYEQQQIYHYIQSRYYRAPEVILGMRYGPAIDMWSFGCVLGELSNGYPLFVGNDEDDQLAAIEEVMGSIPPQMTAKSNVKRTAGSRAHGRGKPGTKPLASLLSGDDHFKDFVAKMLTWDPLVRPTPSDIHDHRWLKIVSRNVVPSASHPGTLPASRSRRESSEFSLT